MGGSELQPNINMTAEATQGMLGLERHLQAPPPTSSSTSWHRMKWTDEMVRLLVVVVYYVGDDSSVDVHPSSSGEATTTTTTTTTNTTTIKKGSRGINPQQQQKKGKWKSVSSAMMERGYNVSPQQCEDKFNDLNKRYKRVTDILGKGTACKVVENQSLLDGMDHLSSKAKEEAKKLLNSKHLFFREMCAYHSTCAAVSAGGGLVVGANHQGNEQLIPPASNVTHQCGHPQATRRVPTRGHGDEDHHLNNSSVIMEEDDEDKEEDISDEDDYGYDDEDDEAEVDDEYDSVLEFTGTKRGRPLPSPPATSCQLLHELKGLTGTGEQQKQWVRLRIVELQERIVGHQRRALELERKRFKWQKFSWNKETEMEKSKLDNERLKLENERMLLLLRQKEVDLFLGGKIAGGNPSASFPVAVQQRDRPQTTVSNRYRDV